MHSAHRLLTFRASWREGNLPIYLNAPYFWPTIKCGKLVDSPFDGELIAYLSHCRAFVLCAAEVPRAKGIDTLLIIVDATFSKTVRIVAP